MCKPMTKHCIWCGKDEDKVSFDTEAHTIPQSLGGQNICINVCDDCNSHFGNRTTTSPAVDLVFKETFGVARHRFLSSDYEKKGKQLKRFTSIYFDIKPDKVKIKSQYKFNSSFQSTVCRQLKKGIFKVFLEETERQQGRGHDEQFNFIREFCKYDFGDYPVIYFERTNAIYPMTKGWVENPVFILDPDYKFKYLVECHGFFEFELLGHTFAIPTIRNWELAFDLYLKESISKKIGYFDKWRFLKNFNDVDLLLHALDK
jgi:hypothetical protein